jgi:hypothetical protein
MHMCFQHHVIVLNAILCWFLNLTWSGLPCQMSISELIFCVGSMLEHDAHIYAYQWHLVCLHAFNLSFVFYYHHVYERGRSSKNIIPDPVLAIRKFRSYFYVVFKSQKLGLLTLLCFGFVNLWAIGAWQPLQLVRDAKLFVYCCRLLEEWRKGTTSVFLESLI